jgi:hypothetical protein
MLMRIDEACRKASELNRDEQARGTATRYIVLTFPNGAMGSDYQVVPRRVGGPAGRFHQRR